MTLITKAKIFAKHAHQGQLRKYTGQPYIVHPVNVALLVNSVTSSDVTIAAALLHDVVEDTLFTIEDISRHFGKAVAQLVAEVTDVSKPSDGNRAARKEIDRQHLAKASAAGQTIKLADLIDNTFSIEKYDPDFAKVYLAEKWLLLEVLTKGSMRLYERALEVFK